MSASPGELRRSRPDHPASAVSGAPARNRPDRGRAHRAPHWRSRDARRGPGRTCRRTGRRASRVHIPLAPFHLERADPNGVALLGAESAQLTFDSCPDQLSLEVGGRIRRPPVDARSEALNAVTLDPKAFAFALDGPVTTAAGERDAALAGRRRARRFPGRAPIEDHAKEIVGALVRRGRYRDARDTTLRKSAGAAWRGLARLGKVDLIQCDKLRTLRQPAPVAPQLGVDRGDVLEGIWPRCVDHMHEESRALDVAEVCFPETEAAAGPLDESGDVGDDELAIVETRDAEVREERRERIVRDLRSRARERREESGLPRIG